MGVCPAGWSSCSAEGIQTGWGTTYQKDKAELQCIKSDNDYNREQINPLRAIMTLEHRYLSVPKKGLPCT